MTASSSANAGKVNALEYRGVSFRYPAAAVGGDAGNGGQPVLDNITLDVHAGERLGVLGPNGGGKSTLLKLTLGLLGDYEGEVRIFGLTPREARNQRLIGYVPQRTDSEQAFPLSARQVVEMGASLALPPWKSLSAEQRDACNSSLRMVGALEFSERPIGKLSGGQLQRVLIARALALKPRLLLLDEPTVGIDVAGQQQFAALLSDIAANLGITVVIVSHDIRTVAAGCDRIACLSRTLHYHASPKGLTPAVLAEVFRHDVAGIFGDVHVDAHPASACTHHHHHQPGPVA